MYTNKSKSFLLKYNLETSAKASSGQDGCFGKSDNVTLYSSFRLSKARDRNTGKDLNDEFVEKGEGASLSGQHAEKRAPRTVGRCSFRPWTRSVAD